MFKKMETKKAEKKITTMKNFNIDFSNLVEVEDFNEMSIFLQKGHKTLPVYGGAEALLYTITIPKQKSNEAFIDKYGQKIILVGEKFMKLAHVDKMILLNAEHLRTVSSLSTKDGAGNMRVNGTASSSLDRDIAIRMALATSFKPKKVQKVIGARDEVISNSVTTVSKGIFNTSNDHYKKTNHGLFKNSDKLRVQIKQEGAFKNESDTEDQVNVVDCEPEGCHA